MGAVVTLSTGEDRWGRVVALGVAAVAVAALAVGVVLAPLFAGKVVPQALAAWIQHAHRPLFFLSALVAYGLPWWGLRRVHGHAARDRDVSLRRRDGAILWLAVAGVTLLLAAPSLLPLP